MNFKIFDARNFCSAAPNTGGLCGGVAGTLAIVMLIALAAVVLPGCMITSVDCGRMDSGVNDFVPVASLPATLDMRSERINSFSASMTDQMNTLLVLSRPDYKVLLNGRQINAPGEVCRSRGRLMVRRTLVARLRQEMRQHNSMPALASLAVVEQPAVSSYSPGVSAVVVVDAGHGGNDPGAVYDGAHPEKYFVLDMAKKLRDELSQRGIRVIMTRDDDTFVELNERAAIANRANADLFVSIHVDSNPSSSVRGHTLYIARSASSGSKKLADSVDRSLKGITPGRRGLRRQDFRVLVRTDMPAILVETGFITNYQDRQQLNSSDYRTRISRAIASGVVDYLRGR